MAVLAAFGIRAGFKSSRTDVAPNLQVLLERQPVVVAGAVVLPCPLLRQADVEDPLSWLQQLNAADLTGRAPDRFGPRLGAEFCCA